MPRWPVDPDIKVAKESVVPVKALRDEKGRILKGQTLNPGGMPKKAAEVREFAKIKSMEAMKMVHSILGDEDQKTADRLAAARVILQAAGVMVQEQRITTTKEDPLKEISSEELKKFLQMDGQKS
jgi:hypothetical protein